MPIRFSVRSRLATRTAGREGARARRIGRARRALARAAAVLLAVMVQRPALKPSVAQPPPPAPSGSSAPTDIKGVIEGKSARRIPLAVAPTASSGSAAALGPELRQVLAEDLAYSGYFDMIDPSRFNGFSAPAPESTNLTPWRALGADALLSPRLLPQGKQIALEGRLYDTASSEMIMGKRYGAEIDLARRAAHRLANDVIEHFTGQPGVALSRIAFVSRNQGGKELYVMDYDGYRVRRLTTSGTINLSPVWSPDGTRLAFLSFRQRSPAIYVLEADGAITKLPTAGGDLNSAPDWSPDGTRLAYATTRDGNCEIYVMENVHQKNASHRERRLTEDRGIDSSPSWSPTGREIAFTSDRGGSPQIYVMDAEGGNVRRLTYDGKRNDSPAWSPKGDKVAYVSRVEGKFALMLLDLGTQQAAAIVSGPFNCEDPRWSFDGRHLTFSSDREGSYDIYTVDADGANLRRLTKGTPSYTPDWSR